MIIKNVTFFEIESSRDEGEPLTFTIGVGKLKLLTF